LILAPLAVSKQTQREGKKFGIPVTVARDQSQIVNGINVTNYEILHKFEASKFAGIVLDESSILKSFTGAIRNQIIQAFSNTPYRLACTATPSPNDFMELGNHSEFLGVRSRTAMLATYFTHDGGETSKWRLKRHAEKDYWRDIASWAVMLEKPSDLGYSDKGYDLLPIERTYHTIATKAQKGVLFARAARTLSERREAKAVSVDSRIELARQLVENDSKQQWLLWGNLNAEATAAANAIGAVEVAGSDTPEYKEDAFLGFASGKYKDLVTKYKIGGFGMNWQNCARMLHLSLTDSYESMHQGESRCRRFGQTQQVQSHILITDRDGEVVKNMERKQKQAQGMREAIVEAIKESRTQL
jgi:hypothetical protein